jgi:hypothetical protein
LLPGSVEVENRGWFSRGSILDTNPAPAEDVCPMRITALISVQILLLSCLSISSTANHGQPEPNAYAIGPNVHVSAGNPQLEHYETCVAADPRKASHLIAGAYTVNSDGRIDNVFYISFDHGKTWTHTLTVATGVDPSCAIGANGVVLASSIHDITLPNGKTDSFLVVHRSLDGGRTWRQSSIKADTASIDRAYVTIDDRHSRVYVHGYLQQPKDDSGKALPPKPALYTSVDDGVSFDRAATQPGAEFNNPWFFPASGIVANDGSFNALVLELDKTKRNMSYKTNPESAPKGVNGALELFCSRDEGRTLELVSKIADVYNDWRVPQLSVSSLATDHSHSRFRGRMYAAWPDARIDRRTQVFFCYSDDGGHTWSPPAVVSENTGVLKSGDRANNFMPVIAVNKMGVVGVCWYDRRDNPDNLGYWIRFSASLDGGQTWLPSARLSTHPNLSDDKDARPNGGDTAGLAADDDGVFHPVWIDNRTGVHQMWTTTVTVIGKAEEGKEGTPIQRKGADRIK